MKILQAIISKFWYKKKTLNTYLNSYYNSDLSNFYTSTMLTIYWPSANRVSPDDNQAVSTACFDPVVDVKAIGGQPVFSGLPGGISKPCQSFSHQLQIDHRVVLHCHKVAVTQRKAWTKHWPKAELLSFDCVTTHQALHYPRLQSEWWKWY